MSESQLAHLYAGANKLQDFRYTYVAAASIASYEYFINIDNEIRFLWDRSFSFGRVLLFLCRYLPLVQAFEGVYLYTSVGEKKFNSSYCRGLIDTSTILIGVQFVVSTWLAAMLFVSSLSIRTAQFLPYRIGDGCFFTVKTDAAKYSFIKIIFDDTLALGLLLVKAIQQTKFGVLYFFLNLAINITNMCLFGLIPLSTMEGVLQNILCARLLFHIQAENEASLVQISISSHASFNTVAMERIGAMMGSDLESSDIRSTPLTSTVDHSESFMHEGTAL
ncbi:hypothetical protein SCHPADRAFT_738694 [Schizopora paradoxa]|uniref:DUF6533 domain-containing protein n=1 Tax=Schizopora paradoxa TaxID=27342 RepID=A0A0H2R6E6_9AGAM|nr:hypothetical protein SCHPADRAFT_738694 [Schizopora paradoxa]